MQESPTKGLIHQTFQQLTTSCLQCVCVCVICVRVTLQSSLAVTCTLFQYDRTVKLAIASVATDESVALSLCAGRLIYMRMRMDMYTHVCSMHLSIANAAPS